MLYIIFFNESATLNNDTNVFKDARKLFNERRSSLFHTEINKIRNKLYKKGATYKVLKDNENQGSLTSRQKNMLFNDERYLKNFSIHLKNLKKHFKKYQYDLDYLLNEPQPSIMILSLKML